MDIYRMTIEELCYYSSVELKDDLQSYPEHRDAILDHQACVDRLYFHKLLFQFVLAELKTNQT